MRVPTVSVIIPAYNCGAFIGASIRSVLNQTVRDLELIVMDDGSTDTTADEIRRHADPRLVWLRTPTNQGVSRATNAGIACARGEYLAALAADDMWLPTKLERQLAHLSSNAGIDASYTWIRHLDAEGTPSSTIERNDLGADPVRTLLTSRRIKLACTLLIPRHALARTGSLDPRLRTHEDWEYVLRLTLAGVSFGCVPEPLTLVRRRPDSLSHSQMSVRDMGVALATVWRLRRAHPGRITGVMVACCGLRSLGWVGACRVRSLLGAAAPGLLGLRSGRRGGRRPPCGQDSTRPWIPPSCSRPPGRVTPHGPPRTPASRSAGGSARRIVASARRAARTSRPACCGRSGSTHASWPC